MKAPYRLITRSAPLSACAAMLLVIAIFSSVARAQSRFQTPVKDIAIFIIAVPTDTAETREVKVRKTGDKEWKVENPDDENNAVVLTELRRGEASIELFDKKGGEALVFDLVDAQLMIGKADASGFAVWLQDASEGPDSQVSIILAGDKNFAAGQ